MTTTAGQWIRDKREFQSLTREQLSARTGLSVATLARVENGAEGGFNQSTIMAIAGGLKLAPDSAQALADWMGGQIKKAEFLRIFNGYRSVEAFLQEKGFTIPEPRTPGLPPPAFMVAVGDEGVPVLGAVSASGMVESRIFEDDEFSRARRVPLRFPGVPRVYALAIDGDSMSPEYRSGETLIVRDAAPEELEDGEDAVIQCDGAAGGCSTFKRVIMLGGDRVRLIPLNTSYDAVECEMSSIVRVGKVLGVYRARPQRKGR